MEKFEIKSGVVVCSDPCYEIPTWCQGIINNVKSGTWYADIEKKDVGSWGLRVHSMTIIHENHLTNHGQIIFDYLNPIGNYGVDSGQFGFFDKEFYRNDSAAESLPKVDWADYNKEDGDEWYKACAEITLSENLGGVMGAGAVTSSGYGDGSYPVFGNLDEGEYISLKVIFIEEDYEEDEDYYEEDEDYYEEEEGLH